ncbi:methyl-accepting chemotaxis protein [Geoalkalibacter halelectricus]|uniref:Methyl-accepting chemotaxis protein n=1 Tax=Geoalkalibacter halelectricus TaxID=2847045 RepID=A0ABY5ZRK2_9BACT|nr:methyl-accepting chemotaxis protein [Geoalkalibacter halelectricus]MDO3376925.1 methyl-accepting chemotaxis protein [Geoalkalibacter halelectricus]UWZ81149.1 methyl-accepting chemotaxis protein [Geoalkalibacter halelectricus]
MQVFKAIYGFLEESFFNSLTKKLAGNLGFLFLLQAGGLAVILYGPHGIKAAPWILGGSLVLFVLNFLFLRYLLLGPVRLINGVLKQIASAEGDLSVRLQAASRDELGDLADNCNAALHKLREMFLGVRRMGVGIAVNAAQLSSRVDAAADNARNQEVLAQDIFAGSNESKSAHDEIADRTQRICTSTSRNLEAARSTAGELAEVAQNIHHMSESVEQNQQTVTRLDDESQQIQKIIGLIRSISAQTSLLALNAAIEAARAGQAGKGFSIVADEVKKLAGQVDKASTEIEEKVGGMLEQIRISLEQSKDISNYAHHSREVVTRACAGFETMVRDFEENDAQLQGISASVEELSAANEEIHGKVGTINQASRDVGALMRSAEQATGSLKHTTEDLLETVAVYRTGEGALEGVIAHAAAFRGQAVETLRVLLSQGCELFDTHYQPIPGTQPQKYRTRYDEAFATALQPIYDRFLNDLPGASFAICVDRNGYAPTHNSRYAQPLTGDPQADLANSRDKRIYKDPTGLRAAQNDKPLLLQTYMRDTGEILCDLSLPILIDGRAWGSVRLGFKPQILDA